MSADMELRPGELVDIDIRGARIIDTAIGMLAVAVADGGDETRLELAITDQVTVRRIAPAEWPPVYGDMWRDADGDLWTMGRDQGDIDRRTWSRFLCLDQSVRGIWQAQAVLAQRGPMTLVHREPVHQNGELVAATTGTEEVKQS